MLTRQQAEQILEDVLRQQSETDEAECKAGLGDPFQKAVCALSNRRDRNGGVVFVGVRADYSLEDLRDVERLTEAACDMASDTFNVPLRVNCEVLERDGQKVLAVIVPACPSGARPCHFKKHGPYEGAYIRVNNSTRQMTRDEVRREIADDEIARGTVLPFDRLPYPHAGLEVFEDSLVDEYVAQVKKLRPGSSIDRQSREQMLRDINAVADFEGKLHPTHAGLLFFCAQPQRHLPQSSVEFMHLWGRDLTTSGPDGSKWRTNREFRGTLAQIIDALEGELLERMDTRGFVDSFRRRDEPEYPRVAVREAIINAIAHRDYTMRGARVQVRLFSDRLEVDTPGGLPAPVTVDNIEDEKFTRNEAVVGILESINYVERRGWGFNNMVQAMRVAGLAPPLLVDNGASFRLCLKSHVLMSPEGLEWLHRFDGIALEPAEKLALAYLRINERLYNRDFVRLNECSIIEATQALRRMVEKGVLEMRGTRGGAYYVLPEVLPTLQPTLLDAALSDEDKILQLARRKGEIRVSDCMEELGMTRKRASKLLLRLSSPSVGRLLPHNKSRRWRFYTLS